MTLYGTPPGIHRPPFVNACTVCEYTPGPTALFCRSCGNMTTRDPLSPKHVKAKKPLTQMQQWEKRMAIYRKRYASNN